VKKVLSLLFGLSLVLVMASSVLAKPQIVDSDEAYGADGNPANEGAVYTGDFVLTMANGDDLGDTAGLSLNAGDDDRGTAIFDGSSNVSGTVGTNLSYLSVVDVAGINAKVTFNDEVFAETFTISGDGSEVRFEQDPNLDSLVFQADATAIFAHDITYGFGGSPITTDKDGKGTITFEGSGIVWAPVGASRMALSQVIVDGDSPADVAFGHPTFADTFSVTGTGRARIEESFKGGNLNFEDDGVVAFQGGSDLDVSAGGVTTDNDGEGSLYFEKSSTVSGPVGASTLYLSEITVSGDAPSVVTFEDDVFVDTFSVTGTGKVVFDGSLEGETLNFKDDGVVLFAEGANLDVSAGGITTTTHGEGTLYFEGSSTVSGPVGTNAIALSKVIVAGDAPAVVTFEDDVFVDTFSVTGTGKVVFDGNLGGENLR